jgi:hypothetical protein
VRAAGDTPASKEIEAKLAAIQAERDKQDAMLWGTAAAQSQAPEAQVSSSKYTSSARSHPSRASSS